MPLTVKDDPDDRHCKRRRSDPRASPPPPGPV